MTDNFRWHDAELDAALDLCRATHTGVSPCHDAEYMAARRHYHTLLVARGLMRRKDMDATD